MEVARLLERAYAAIYDERYARAVDLCDLLLRVDPGYAFLQDYSGLDIRISGVFHPNGVDLPVTVRLENLTFREVLRRGVNEASSSGDFRSWTNWRGGPG